ncbi:hypothetical protein LDL59_03305 [Kaistella anthropi]|nr:hypothetical protein [Kaistella anthropi]
MQDSDLDVQLKGINVASTNLKNFKGNKLIFLNFWELGALRVGKNGQRFKNSMKLRKIK